MHQEASITAQECLANVCWQWVEGWRGGGLAAVCAGTFSRCFMQPSKKTKGFLGNRGGWHPLGPSASGISLCSTARTHTKARSGSSYPVPSHRNSGLRRRVLTEDEITQLPKDVREAGVTPWSGPNCSRVIFPHP